MLLKLLCCAGKLSENQMNIVIRADASNIIGYGHIMRCLTLADALTERRHSVQFVCRDLKGNINNLIVKHGYVVLVLPFPELSNSCSEQLNENEANVTVSQLTDVKETLNALGNINVDWFIVDHYSLDSIWHKEIYSCSKKIMVIDELANRYHECDILLDQTYGRSITDYDDLTNHNCIKLIGSSYSLLRKQYYQFRLQAEEKRNNFHTIKKILISMGGVDAENISAIVLDGLEAIQWEENIEVDIILGENSPYIEIMKRKVESSKLNTKILSDVENMAELMLEADLAIGAGGTTSWERCCMGLPSLMVIYADNQLSIVENISAAGAGINIGRSNMLTALKVSQYIENILESETMMNAMSKECFVICDGLGADRVVERLT